MPDQRTRCRHEESPQTRSSSSRSSNKMETWQEFYTTGIGEIKMRRVIDRGLVRTGRLARSGKKKRSPTNPAEDEAESSKKEKKNTEVAAVVRKFEVEFEKQHDSTHFPQTKPKNTSKAWKKTNLIEVKNESSKRRQEMPINSPKTPRLKRLNKSKLNRTSARPKLLTPKPDKTLSKFEKLLHDWELSRN